MLKRCLICAIAVVASVFGSWARSEITSSVIIVCPKGWESSTDEWVNYREQDYQVIKVDSVSSSNDLKFAILKAVNKSKLPVTAVLLCGDIGVAGDLNINRGKFTPITPTFETETKVKLGPFTTPTLATDLYYGDLDGDECPELAVGRLPAKDAQD